jgi:hypothetical protein
MPAQRALGLRSRVDPVAGRLDYVSSSDRFIEPGQAPVTQGDFALGLSDDGDGASERQRLEASATQEIAG